MLRSLGVNGDALKTEATLMQSYSDMAVGAIGKIGDAFTKHVELVISGQETIGQALLSGTNEIALSLAREALPRSFMELAAGFAALTNPITAPTAPLHFTAAAIFGTVAAGAGLVAGATGAAMASAPPSAAAGTQAARGLAPRSSLGSSTGDLGAVTVVQSSLVPAGPVDAQRARDGLRTVRRQGFGDRVPRRIEH